jgi:hypothetical protein
MNKLRQYSLPLFLLSLYLHGPATIVAPTDMAGGSGPAPQSQEKRIDRERERAYAKQQFTKNFHDLQTLGKELLQDHETTRLTPSGLEKNTRSINKCARALRALIALGEMAKEEAVTRKIDTPYEFDESIRKLAGLIRNFAHNPVHQNSKVFNTGQAERAQTDLLTIINLSKVLESKARKYTPAPQFKP